MINSLAIGGSEKSLICLLNSLDYSQFQIDLFMLKRDEDLEKYIPKEVNILDIPEYYQFISGNSSNINIMNKIRYLICRIITSVCLFFNKRKKMPMQSQQILYKNQKKVLKSLNSKYDVAIAYAQGFPTYFVADKVKANKKICWINCDYANSQYNNQFDEFYYTHFSSTVVVSQSIKESIESLNKSCFKGVTLLYDNIDSNLINQLANQSCELHKVNELKILTVGRLIIGHKGYDLAIETAKLLKDKGYKFKWYVIGEGEDRVKIEKLIKDHDIEENFILLGKKINPYSYMKACDIYVQTSRKEGLGLTVLEAKILKKNIVCTEFNTVSELIQSNFNGLVVPMNPNLICEGIIRFIEDKEFCNLVNYNLREQDIKSSLEQFLLLV